MSVDTDKVKEPNLVQVNALMNELRNIDINRITPKSEKTGITKRILDCTLGEIQYMFWPEGDENAKMLDIAKRASKLFRNEENLAGNFLLQLRLGKNRRPYAI